MKPTKKTYGDRIEYQVDGKLHREDGPAVIFSMELKYGFVMTKFIGKMVRQ